MAQRSIQTFLFADLAGFTALTEAHGDEEAADLVADFCARVRTLLEEYGAEEVKGIGDALMLRVDEADQAIDLALQITNKIGGRHEFPSVRVGMHTGAAVERAGDWFGSTVNLASRVAGGGKVRLTRRYEGLGPGPDEFDVLLRHRPRSIARSDGVSVAMGDLGVHRSHSRPVPRPPRPIQNE